ncbi:MAG TPA: DUF4173 domain-containing protein [Cytophagales bacterium]|nr:DUF4173 domain-containing protein [Cytophagales bacterium]
MKTINIKFLLTLLLTLIYNIFFWEEELGINLLIFSVLLISALLYLNPYSWFHRNAKITILGTLITGVGVVLFNSSTSKLAHVIFTVVMVGFIHQAMLKTLYYAFLQFFVDLYMIPSTMKSELRLSFSRNTRFNVTFGYLRLSVIPLLILAVFYWIYKMANPVFDQLSSDFWDQLATSFSFFFESFSFGRLMFILIGFWLIAAGIYNQNIQRILGLQVGKRDQLLRIKTRKEKEGPSLNLFPKSAPSISMKLRSFLRSGVILLVMVNALLLIVNGIDINWVWFDFNPKSVQDLRQFVHEGTYLLILSIVLSVLILLYYFQGNINFHSKNRFIKILAYTWIFQNAILALSVGIRNYHYIHSYGLAYKRIGVVIFLILTLFGLITLFLKIKNTNSAFYLYKINTLSLYGMLVLMSLVNWDVFIASFNIKNYKSEVIDTHFLLTLSDKSLHVLMEHKELFSKEETEVYRDGKYTTQQELLEKRARRFINDYEHRNWLSWNLAEAETYDQLKGMLPLITQSQANSK